MDGRIKRWKRSGARFKFVRDLDLKKKTTMGVGGTCRFAIFPSDVQSLAIISRDGDPVIGCGSNVVMSDEGLERCVFTARLDGISIRDGVVRAECGVGLPHLARITARCGYTGLEALSGIPGSVGGAVRMNAGCFGTEMSDVLQGVGLATERGIVELSNAELGFGYKRSLIPTLGTVLWATFRLNSCDPEYARAKIDAFTDERKRRFPAGRSCGCYFKRVDGVSAGYYVEKAGLKGLKIGGAEVSARHGAFIMNTGDATAEDVITLAGIVKEEVKRVCSVTLEEEVEFYGKF